MHVRYSNKKDKAHNSWFQKSTNNCMNRRETIERASFIRPLHTKEKCFYVPMYLYKVTDDFLVDM